MGDRNPGCELGENKINYYGSFLILKYHTLLFYEKLLISPIINTAENAVSPKCVELVQLKQRFR
jgi:hypothetical protein